MFKYENDSRKVTKGQTFIAIKGLTVDGHNYIEKAIEKGAEKIICEKDLDIDIPYEKVENTTQYQKEILSKEYGCIINKLNIIGITGTNGKTTSCYLIYQMLEQLGIDVAYIGTLGFYYKDEHIELTNTTPDILVLYQLLVKAQEQGCKVVIMEVSSQALSYDRLYGIKFSLIGFTNLTEDHLDYHKTMDNYLNAKLLILDHLTDDAKIIANCDDEKYTSFKKDGHKFITFGNNGDYKIINYITNPSSTDLTFEYNNKDYNVSIPLNSKFNIYNYLTMLCVVNQYGVSIENIIKNTNILKAPKGRCETYKVKNGYAVIDYAHSPDAVLKVITAYNELKKNRIITIIGCGGDRDPKKRPIMGQIATDLSDFVIFTNDNPRTEDPTKIMTDILSGVKKENYKVVYDRKEAIKYGLDMLEKDDIILLLGKGHENYQIIGREKIHLDDSEEILNYEE
ncbi:MAG: UDP-N-acetylmuramoyl-L-alanyl-D-glutamate--2,6-diaminopimelate ligase [Bacilli bacterium]